MVTGVTHTLAGLNGDNMPALIQAKDGTIWDAETQPNPDVHGNESRNSFKWNCYHHRLGQLFQNKVKPKILRAIDTIHQKNEYNFEGDFLSLQTALYESIRTHINEDPERKQPFMLKIADIIVYGAYNNSDISKLHNNKLFRTSLDFVYRNIKIYDSEAFTYDDVRLQKISEFLHKEICIHYQDDPTLLKIIDIIIFLMKEDIYYRPRWILILQDIEPTVKGITERNPSVILIGLSRLCRLCKGMKLTPTEIENIERWH